MSNFDLYGVLLYTVSAFLLLFASVRAVVPDHRVTDVYRAIEVFVVFLAIAIASFDISLRPYDMEGDTAVYINFFNDLNAGFDNPFQTFEPGFVGLVRLFGYFSLDYHSLFYVITFSFLGSYYLLIRAVMGRDSAWILYVFAVMIFYPFFLSLTANIIRQGFALSFINLALLYGVKNHWKKGVLFTVIATLFHKSSIVYFPFFAFRRWILKTGVYGVVALWLAVSLASYLRFFGLLVDVLFDFLSGYGLVVNYSDVDNIDYVVGFRWDFWIFSSLAVFFLVVLKVIGGELNKRETYLFYVGAFLAILHIAMFDVAYNDRFGIYAWIFYPLELAYVIRAVMANFINGKRRKDSRDHAAAV
ncbi:EpsG family protein [Pseudomonas sp. Eth.TT006]